MHTVKKDFIDVRIFFFPQKFYCLNLNLKNFLAGNKIFALKFELITRLFEEKIRNYKYI